MRLSPAMTPREVDSLRKQTFWIDRPIPQPKKRVPYIDERKKNDWLAAQPPAAREPLSWLLSNVRCHPQEEFDQELRKSFEAYLQTRTGNKPILFVLRDPHRTKSEHWVISKLHDWFSSETRGFLWICDRGDGEIGGNPYLPEIKAGKYDVVYADDASFSGKAAAKISLAFYYALGMSNPNPIPIAFVIPFTTKPARALIGQHYKRTQIYSSVTIPTVGELCETLPPEIRARYLRERWFRDEGEHAAGELLSKSLDLFDHKLPDSWSFHRLLRHGEILFEENSQVLCASQVSHEFYAKNISGGQVKTKMPFFIDGIFDGFYPPYFSFSELGKIE